MLAGCLVALAASAQQPMDMRAPGEDTQQDHQIQLKPPGADRLWRLESEGAFQERLRQEARQRPSPERIEFPKEIDTISKESYVQRSFPPLTEMVEPYFVNHRRLYFEQKNLERYGWDLGCISPFVCVGKFWWDTALLPYRFATDPCCRYDSSTGQCLPGDPVPLLLYPPQVSASGTALEIGTIVALLACFP